MKDSKKSVTIKELKSIKDPWLLCAALDKAAADESTSTDVLQWIVKIGDDATKQLVAMHKNTDKDTVDYLAKSDNPQVAYSAISNENISVDILTEAVESPRWKLREAAAKNPNLPKECFDKLKNTSSDSIKRCLAQNPNSPIDILVALYGEKPKLRGIIKSLHPEIDFDMIYASRKIFNEM